MGLPPLPPPPIRLVPRPPRASSLGAIGISLALHGGIIAVSVAGTGGSVSTQASSASPPRRETVPVLFAGFDVSTRPTSSPTAVPTPPRRRADLPPAPHVELAAASPLPIDVPAVASVAIPAEPARPSVETRLGIRAPTPNANHGLASVAELRGRPSDACPELRRPRPGNDRDTLAVAVAFVVDTVGRIDPSTLRVVQAPGRPDALTGFVPHIYTISTSARVDRSLPTEVSEYGAILADDVLSHVSGLRFRPGSRNGRPAESMVLIACQVT
jgi:hypothetical protein